MRRVGSVGAALALAGGGVVWFALADHAALDEPLTIVLAAVALGSVLAATSWRGVEEVSASFVCSMLAVAFLGPAAAFGVAVVAELGRWAVERYRPFALAANLACLGLPNLLAGTVFGRVTERSDEGSPAFLGALALVMVGYLALNFALVSTLKGWHDGIPLREALRFPRPLVPTLALTVALTVALAGVLARYGSEVAALVALLAVAFGYMARLVFEARERTRQYASLSWGVLSGLLRTLDHRDRRTARHSAAVAAFARDIAAESGHAEREQELAHTAGLLHDLGKFALADHVLERGGTLRERDWRDVQRHPELGAELLKDLGVYGPVAQIVRAHHERLDGRGYPDRLQGEDIPAIARIVAVAEVYDTLTAEDTYRTPMSSFAALTELRRVAGTQLDEAYVEALGRVLAGRGADERRGDDADFDRELDMARRLTDAVG